MSEHDDGSEDVLLDRAVLLGVWVNGTRAHLSRDEITIDFVREVAELPRPVLVARILTTPRAVFDLRDDLDEVSADYTHRSMPGDVT